MLRLNVSMRSSRRSQLRLRLPLSVCWVFLILRRSHYRTSLLVEGVVPEIAESAIREVFVYRYRLIYQVGLDDVRILAVIPGAMDYRAWLQRS